MRENKILLAWDVSGWWWNDDWMIECWNLVWDVSGWEEKYMMGKGTKKNKMEEKKVSNKGTYLHELIGKVN